MKTSAILSLIFVALLAACGTKEEELSYNLKENNCPTGEHSFNSKEALCEGLQDSALNHFCASALRAKEFQLQGCPGQYREVVR